MNILITGVGYLSSHFCTVLNQDDCYFILSRSSTLDLSKYKAISEASKVKITLIDCDLSDIQALETALKDHKIEIVIHLAWAHHPNNLLTTEYDFPNLRMTRSLIESMKKTQVRRLIFASSAAVYGLKNEINIEDQTIPNPHNLYGLEKLRTELLLEEFSHSETDWSILCLRFFNITGYGHSLDYNWRNHPKISLIDRLALDAALEKATAVEGDFIRDYIHVIDAANSILSGLKWLKKNQKFDVINIGSGTGSSLSQLINVFEKNCGVTPKIKWQSEADHNNRCIADLRKAHDFLGVKIIFNINLICHEAWQRARN